MIWLPMKLESKNLPKELQVVVDKTLSILGEVIKEEGGPQVYKTVEKIRQLMAEYRKDSAELKGQTLTKTFDLIQRQKPEYREPLFLSFTLMLEVINACEAGYRTYRLQSRDRAPRQQRQDNTIVYVLTAHPTEARTSQNIEIFRRIQSLVVRILDKSGEEDYMCSIIKHNLKLAWLLPITLHEKPKVTDEASHIFSIVMRSDIFDTLLRSDRDIGNVRLRTWVGGDKDGHPGVDEKVMAQCLQVSRGHFIETLQRVLKALKEDINFLKNEDLNRTVSKFLLELKSLAKISPGDFDRVVQLKAVFQSLDGAYLSVVGERSPRLRKIESIFRLFPALVIPIEIREDSEIVQQAIVEKHKTAIYRMLVKLKEIAGTEGAESYAQGFILSMCHSYKDVQAAIDVLKQIFGRIEIPVIPLFETAAALDLSNDIVKQMIANMELRKNIKTRWKNQLEVMLGYSDSSKGMGVLPSRLGIAKAIRSLDIIITEAGFVPVFFHGSGGSVDRGGGSLKNQTAWWPKSALSIYKATIQGEMVERNFNSAEVAMSGVDKILENFNRVKFREGTIKINKAVEEFSEKVKHHYTTKLKEEDFFKVIEAATPYSYLSELKLGSRPSKRSSTGKLDFSSIRAIPWILCWTQTRILFPTWWGVGSAWGQTRKKPAEVERLKASMKSSFLFSSYMKVLGFTLSKVELPIFKLYLENSDLPEDLKEKVFKEFQSEYKEAVAFVRAMTGEKDLLWYRPWLADSIKMRSPMIHPLNILQIIAFQERDMALLRKTVAGISSGMMTTG